MGNFADKEFKSGGKMGLIKNCPTSLEDFKELGLSEEEVIEKATAYIVYGTLLREFRKDPTLTEMEFKVSLKKPKVIQKIDLNKLTEEQKNTLRSMGII